MNDGTVLLARSSGGDDNKRWTKRYGQLGRLQPLFDRCLAVPARRLPLSLEVLFKPGSWAAVIIHSPDASSQYPFPFGYITADTNIVASYKQLIAELAAAADGTSALLWTRLDEDAHHALTAIDASLDIGVA
jgi:hypothetical protein